MNDQDQAIVIGGGIAGVSSALSLADSGCQVYVIEKKPSIGGHALRFGCKATDQCNSCGVCLARDKIIKAASCPNIHLLTQAEVVDVQESGSGFVVTVRRKPQFIDVEKCTACSLCYQRCPKPDRAISRAYLSPIPSGYVINQSECLLFQEERGDCDLCRTICPAGAISFDQQEELITLRASVVIVASGFSAYDARRKGHFGYGRLRQVISGLDLEQRLLAGEAKSLVPRAAGDVPRIAFVQCVGSRDPHIGQDYCSRVCCKYAVRAAAKLKFQIPEAEITIFFIDLQRTEREFLGLLERMSGKIRLVKGLPVEIGPAAEGGDRVSMRYENIDQGRMERADFDLVVLSVGVAPSEENQSLAQTLGLKLGLDGFFAPLDLTDSTITARPGIFLAGTCQGPKSLVESILHGQEAAMRALALMRRREEVRHG
ncbi:MAG: FAD-dependent oxidoreductase [bacterium]|nr:FAD-dependent oxidoreductase [bacterium]